MYTILTVTASYTVYVCNAMCAILTVIASNLQRTGDVGACRLKRVEYKSCVDYIYEIL